MDYSNIYQKAQLAQKLMKETNKTVLAKWETAFEIEYAHESTAIEGNTLTLMETKVILEDQLSIGGKKLREIYEVINHQKAYRFIKEQIADGKPLSEDIVKDIHSILMENIFQGGFYRDVNVRITGAAHRPPEPREAYQQTRLFFADLPWRSKKDALTLAAWTHAEFIRIHPFIDGNGRTCRLMMNYQLLSHGLLPVSIPKAERLEYFHTLEAYATEGNIEPFTAYLARLEEKALDEFIDEFK